jgi:hypothetical protein
MNEFKKMSDEEYHATDALSHSGIIQLLRSPAHYQTPRKVTPAMDFGRAFHLATLQPKKFAETYIQKPEGMSFATKDGKAWRAMAEDSGKQIISAEDHSQIQGMAQAILNSKSAMAYLGTGGETEVSGFWDDPIYPDVRCRLRADYYDGQVIVDLKKCIDARKDKFTSDAYKFGYHIEAAWYLYGCGQITKREHRDFVFVAVESDPPHGVGVYRVDGTGDFVQEGLKQCNRAVDIYKKCRDSGTWDGYPDTVQDLTLPGWVKRKDPNIIYE